MQRLRHAEIKETETETCRQARQAGRPAGSGLEVCSAVCAARLMPMRYSADSASNASPRNWLGERQAGRQWAGR